jgi:hypothetical protein
MGQPYMKTVHAFGRNKGRSLRSWLNLCERIGANPDAMAEALKLPVEERRSFLLTAAHAQDIKEMAARYELNANYVYDLVNGTSAKPIAEFYVPLSKALGLSLDELSTCLEV